MMIRKRFWFLAVLLALAATAQADIYKWVAADGTVHFSSSKPPNGEAEKYSLPETSGDESITLSKGQPQLPSVDLYITSWCPYCKKAMAFLRANQIAFNVYDVEADLRAAERKRQIAPGYQGVPLAVINGTMLRGFDEEDYRAALGLPAQ